MATIRSYSGLRAVHPSPLTRISYQVGRPWMLEGNTFFPVTGIPMRKMACMRRPLALADPVPLTVAILRARSLIRASRPSPSAPGSVPAEGSGARDVGTRPAGLTRPPRARRAPGAPGRRPVPRTE